MRSYNSYFNFIIGARGCGKTFDLKKFLLKKYIKTKRKFMYVRRGKTELDAIDKEKFFNQTILEQVFTDFEIIDIENTIRHSKMFFTCSNFNVGEENCIMVTSSKVYLNNIVICYMKALSTWVDLKGSEYDDVDSILFDEALIDMSSKTKRYLDNEVNALFNLIFSVFRNRLNCHVYLLANACNMNNPYFNYFKFEGDNNKRFWNLTKRRALIEFSPCVPWNENEEENTDFYFLIKDSDMFDSAVNNEFQTKLGNNIGEIKGYKERIYCIYKDGTFLAVNSLGDRLYIDKKYDTTLVTYTFDIDEIENGFKYLQRNDAISRHIRRNFYNGNIHYKDAECKFKFGEAIKGII